VILLLSAFVVAGAVAWAGWRIARELNATREEDARARVLRLMALFSTGIGAVLDDPRALLTWQPLAATARQLFPSEFAALDRVSGRSFPFGAEQIEAAHARWSADWLAWERTHDADYKLKTAQIEAEISAEGGSAIARARLDAVEREKLDKYQRRYEEYARVSKALRMLGGRP
jgi:hypothetical protein